ncbi:MAG TPA: EamA family transporter [Acidimicrobiales bacterium]|nr:EamA family transporter [Acidimicrobiales bacterium]
MALALGLAVAVVYGTADFLGGLATRRNPAFVVVALSQVWGVVVLAAASAVLTDATPAPRDLALGAAAGVVGLLGVGLLYQALSSGSMGVVAPITAVGAAVLPLAWGLASGERPAVVSLVGIVVALVAVALVAGGAPPGAAAAVARHSRRPLGLAIGAGAAFGVLFILLAGTRADAGLSPLVAARVASLAILAVAVLAMRPPLRVAPGSGAAVAGAGLLDMAANVLFLLAVRRGLLSLVAVLASLYPAATSVLARTVLGERLGRLQVGGLGLALVGLVLIAAG